MVCGHVGARDCARCGQALVVEQDTGAVHPCPVCGDIPCQKCGLPTPERELAANGGLCDSCAIGDTVCEYCQALVSGEEWTTHGGMCARCARLIKMGLDPFDLDSGAMSHDRRDRARARRV